MTELCGELGISRKTGHKRAARRAAGGMKGLEEHSWDPKSVTSRTAGEVERLICAEKRLHSTWGPKKIHQILMTKHGLESPSVVSTVDEVLRRHLSNQSFKFKNLIVSCLSASGGSSLAGWIAPAKPTVAISSGSTAPSDRVRGSDRAS